MARKSEGWTLNTDRRTGIRYVRFRTPWGERRNLSTGEKDRSRAQVEAARIYAENVSGRRRATGVAKVELHLACADWIVHLMKTGDTKTLRTYKDYIRAHWVPYFETLDRITDRSVSDYTTARLTKVLRDTVKKELSALRKFLKWAKKADLLDTIPAVITPDESERGTRQKKPRITEIDEELAQKLLAALPARTKNGLPAKAFFTVKWETTLRKGTLQQLRAPDDYFVGRETLFIRPEIDKSENGRELDLTDEARAALDSVCPEEGLIFGPRAFHKALHKAALAIGMSEEDARHVSYHDWRHGAITDALLHSKNLTGVQYMAGHKHVTTTARYVHPSRRAAREAMQARSQGRQKYRDAKRDAASMKPVTKARGQARKAVPLQPVVRTPKRKQRA